MTNFAILWQPQLQFDLSQLCPFLNLTSGTFHEAVPEWPNGYFQLDQNLNNNQFEQVDDAANNHVCIDIKPSPYPPGTPTGR